MGYFNIKTELNRRNILSIDNGRVSTGNIRFTIKKKDDSI